MFGLYTFKIIKKTSFIIRYLIAKIKLIFYLSDVNRYNYDAIKNTIQ